MNGSDVLVVGSINVDMVVALPRLPGPGETEIGRRLTRYGGGKGANAAVAAARLGARVALVAAVGDDDLGTSALDDLRAEGIDVTAVRAVPGEATGAALIAVDANGENQIAVGAGANATLAAHDISDELVAAAGCVVVNLEVPREPVAAAVAAATRHGVPVVVNPAPAQSWVLELASASPLFTPNAREAAWLTGQSDLRAGAERLAELTHAPVVVTDGAAGALVLERPGDAAVSVPAPAGVTAVDTTGAGDTFNGALAVRIAAGDGITAAAEFAVAAAACAVRSRGARAGMPTRDDVAALLRSSCNRR